MTDRATVEQEVRRLHDFFADWFEGVDGRAIREFADSLDREFFIVSPEGLKSTKGEIVDGVTKLFGSGGVKITVRNVMIARNDRGLVTATYEEHHDKGDYKTVRVSTVGMTCDADTPGGYRWLFVHETWLGVSGKT